MSYCISINSLENLPAEQTLLIRYNILCTGTWYLSQLLSAYRNICDSGWTVMYPNIQHPLHTDLPITLTSPGYQATFAWNYGGIPGITPEDFDETHSYLVQLSLFNYYCLNTGETPIGPSTGYTPGGSLTGGSTGLPPTTGGLEVPYIPPPPPGGGTPVILPEPEPSIGGMADPPLVPSIGYSGQQNSGYFNSGYFIVSATPGEGQIGQQSPSLAISVYNISSYHVATPIENTRPSLVQPGGLQNINLVFKPISSSIQQVGNINSSSSTPVIFDPSVGSSLVVPGYSYNSSTQQLGLTSSNFNIYFDLVLLSNEVTIGQPIVISSYFAPPTILKARAIISIQDSNKSINVISTTLRSCDDSNPLTCGTSTQSSFYALGALTVTCKILNEQGNTIAIKSVLIHNLEINNKEGEHNRTSEGGLPSDIVNNILTLSSRPVDIPLLQEESKYLLFTSSESQSRVSLVLVTDFNNQDAYSLGLYPITNWNTAVSGNLFTTTPSEFTANKFLINGEQVYEQSHTVGINNGVVSGSTLMVEIAPTINNTKGDTNGRLYISNNYDLKPITVSVTSVSKSISNVYISTPYVKEKIGLLVNGTESGVIPTSFNVIEQVTTLSGTASFINVSLASQSYYSIFRATNGTINPFTTPIYAGKYN